MARIIRSIEDNVESIYHRFHPLNLQEKNFFAESLIHSGCVLAANTKAKAICTLTSSGYSASMLSHFRPKADIFIFSRKKDLLTRLSLYWGVRSYYYERTKATDETISDLEEILKKHKHIHKGDAFITMASIPIESRQRVNMLKITVTS